MKTHVVRRAAELTALAATMATLSFKSTPGGPEDARPFLADYTSFAFSTYSRTTELATTLAARIDELTQSPSEETLAAARKAWLEAREVYGLTEVLRFWGGPIDDREHGLETFINAWPVDESYIDAVPGRPNGGIIMDAERYPVLDAAVLRVANEHGGETNVCLGWHAIEFLLWGQDTDPAGPGHRLADDFRSGKTPGAARRCEYLRVIGAALVHDLATVRDAWKPDADYRRSFLMRDPAEALRDVMRGMVVLSGFELAGERLAVAYETRDQEQEHSCFSDNTLHDLVNNQRGIAALWCGDAPGMQSGGLRRIAAALDPRLAADLDGRMTASLHALEAIPAPFDQAILGDDDAPGRRALLAALEALEAQTEALAALGLAFGFVIPVRPGV